jgi:hypothetical protein
MISFHTLELYVIISFTGFQLFLKVRFRQVSLNII